MSALHTGSAPHGSTDKPSPITVRKLRMRQNTGLFYRDCFLGPSLNTDIPLSVQKIKVVRACPSAELVSSGALWGQGSGPGSGSRSSGWRQAA